MHSDLNHICVHLLFVSFIRRLVVRDFLHAFILKVVFKIFALSIRFLCARNFDIIMTTVSSTLNGRAKLLNILLYVKIWACLLQPTKRKAYTTYKTYLGLGINSVLSPTIVTSLTDQLNEFNLCGLLAFLF